MPEKRRTGIWLLVAALLLLVSAGAAAASWAVASDTVNIFSIGSVRGRIQEEYEQDQEVWPDVEVAKVVQVKNTGSADSYVRVKLTRQWGSARDEEGRLIPNDMSVENIRYAYNEEDWVYSEADGWYYYREVLAPGKVTEPLITSFVLDKETTGSEYMNKLADIRVSMECLQAAADALDNVWQVNAWSLGIASYGGTGRAAGTAAVEFISPERGFAFSGDGDLFTGFKELVPGEARTQEIEIASSWAEEPVQIGFLADVTEQTSGNAREAALIEQLLKDGVTIRIHDEGGRTLYDGPVWGALDQTDKSAPDTMWYEIPLGTLEAGESSKLTVSLYVDPEVDNDCAELAGKVKWWFTARGAGAGSDSTGDSSRDNSGSWTKQSTPKTGDSRILLWLALLMVLAGIVLLRMWHKQQDSRKIIQKVRKQNMKQK